MFDLTVSVAQIIYYILGGFGIIFGGLWRLHTLLLKKFDEQNRKGEEHHNALLRSIDDLRKYIDTEFVRKDVYTSDLRRIEENIRTRTRKPATKEQHDD